jgi:hypothetical protein
VSAKGRSLSTGDHGFEFHPTPREAITPLLETSLVTLPGGVWIEPCAGTGRIVSTVNEYRSDVRWRLFELDPRVGEFLVPLVRPGIDKLAPFGDFVTRPWPASWTRADVLIMNPPFEHTSAFVAAAFERAHWVVMLQRVGWFGTQERAPWLRRFCPDQYTLPKRPSFRPDGQTDSCEYAWYVWPPGDRERRSGVLAMLDEPNNGQQMLAI